MSLVKSSEPTGAKVFESVNMIIDPAIPALRLSTGVGVVSDTLTELFPSALAPAMVNTKSTMEQPTQVTVYSIPEFSPAFGPAPQPAANLKPVCVDESC
jgi:hypothetical protein